MVGTIGQLVGKVDAEISFTREEESASTFTSEILITRTFNIIG